MNIHVKSFSDLMGSHRKATIACLYTGKVVRHLTINGGDVEIDPNSPEAPTLYPVISVHLSTRILFEPWAMDRGSLVFEHPDFKPFAKICGEGDVLTYEDGVEVNVVPHPYAKKAPHEVHFIG